MKRLLVGMGIGMALTATPVWAYRMTRPPTFSVWDSNSFSALNDTILQIWNISNGRYTLDSLTVTPNGTRNGTKGELVYATYGGNFYICVNTTGTQSVPTKVWKCAQAL